MMPKTSLRYIDFAVGSLAQVHTDVRAAVAAEALTHRRHMKTESGRGDLAKWIINEDTMWPVQWALERACAAAAGQGYMQLVKTLDSELEQTGNYEYAEATIRDTCELIKAFRTIGSELHCKVADDLVEYFELDGLDASDVKRSSFSFHTELERLKASELRRIQQQALFWTAIDDIRSPL
jgi:hypothetical protein